ncbi:hypothetical protein C2S51_015359 [Perilla frutescens var. frutescens]|nr:hypothetical protein C2S51_015359 [Perilla frutescens var. frutescens]
MGENAKDFKTEACVIVKQHACWKDIPIDGKRKMWMGMKRDVEIGEEPNRTTAWRMSRYNNDKKEWTDQASKEVYEELLRLQSEPIENGEYSMSEDEAFVKVLGEEKSSRLRACGDGLKPTSKRGERINVELQKENEELRKQNEVITSQLESITTQVSSQEMNIQAQVEALLKVQLPTLLQSFNQNSQNPNST